MSAPFEKFYVRGTWSNSSIFKVTVNWLIAPCECEPNGVHQDNEWHQEHCRQFIESAIREKLAAKKEQG